MESNSFQMNLQQAEIKKVKSFDFVKYYEPSNSNSKLGDKVKALNSTAADVKIINNKSLKHEKLPNKKKQKVNITRINNSMIDLSTSSLLAEMPLDDSKLTSTPKINTKRSDEIKPIIKKPVVSKESVDTSVDVSTTKRKKRNKSVSFMLEDTEEVAVKKPKSNPCLTYQYPKLKNILPKKKSKKQKVDEKENKPSNSIVNSTTDISIKSEKSKLKVKKITSENNALPSEEAAHQEKRKKKKVNKIKKVTEPEPTEDFKENEGNSSDNENKNMKRPKKKKRPVKSNIDNLIVEGEPIGKIRKKNLKPDLIAESLENLNIGDNAHTITGLIDQMTVVDKKNKKGKQKKKKNNTKNDLLAMDTTEEVKEKVKWSRKKWNKGRKDFIHEDRILTSVIIENIPVSLLLSYKNILAEHFCNCGQIRQIGVAELYPSHNPKLVFSTTVLFDTEEAVTKALEEDNTLLEGNRLRVKRPLPPTLSTIVVKSYADIDEQALSTVFSSAGRIRKINQIPKGKKSSTTAFIEFDSSEEVNRAIEAADGVKINGKKILVFKYQNKYGEKNKCEKKNYNKEDEDDEGSD